MPEMPESLLGYTEKRRSVMSTKVKGTTKVQLRNIVVDPNIQVREVESPTVSEYTEAMKAGCEFPPLILEKGTNRLVCGYHRFAAYKHVLEPTEKVNCILEEFADDAAIIRFAAHDNSQHGRPLDTWDKKRILSRLLEYGDSHEDIAKLLGVTISKVEQWGHRMILVRGNGDPKPMPVKRSWSHLIGTTCSQEEYDEHARTSLGVSPARLAYDLIVLIKGEKIDTQNPTVMARLKELHEALTQLLS